MNKDELQLIDDVRQIVSVARQHAYRAVNVMQVRKRLMKIEC